MAAQCRDECTGTGIANAVPVFLGGEVPERDLQKPDRGSRNGGKKNYFFEAAVSRSSTTGRGGGCWAGRARAPGPPSAARTLPRRGRGAGSGTPPAARPRRYRSVRRQRRSEGP